MKKVMKRVKKEVKIKIQDKYGRDIIYEKPEVIDSESELDSMIYYGI